MRIKRDKDRAAYVTGRYLAAFDATQKRFGLSDAEMDFPSSSKRRLHAMIRRHMAHLMREKDEDGQPTVQEICAAMECSEWVVRKAVYKTDPGAIWQAGQLRMLQQFAIVEAVAELVCKRLGITLEQLRGAERSPIVLHARQMVCGLCRRHTSASYPTIADVFGKPGCHAAAIARAEAFERNAKWHPHTLVAGREFRSWVAQLGPEIEALVAARKAGAA